MALQYRLTTTTIDDLTLDLTHAPVAGPEQSEVRATYLPAEWARQSGVQLTWPHEGTDWAPVLGEVTECYVRMALEIALRERLIVVTPEAEAVERLLRERLPQRALKNVELCQMSTNDTWARDHGFITLKTSTGRLLLDFQFNGWGRKFTADEDNRICRRMMGLMAPNRNQPLTQTEIEQRLKRYLHVERVMWLDHGYLAGDDTDSHIDTLARFCPNDTIAYVQCTDPADEHYAELRLMEEQLRGFRTADNRPYRLIALPMAKARYEGMADEADEAARGQRLPATYANFLCVNGAVLMPTYRDPERDERARRQLQLAFPRHEIVGVDCRVLIEQHGSLHCCTMQFPA